VAKPVIEVIHRGDLEIRKNGIRFGKLWIEKANIYWKGRKDMALPAF
jgi:hypothetical protein